MKTISTRISFMLAALLAFQCPCLASVPNFSYNVDYYRTMPTDPSKMISAMESLRGEDIRDLTLTVPGDVDPNDHSRHAAGRILGHSLQNFVNRSSLNRTVANVQKAMSVDTSIGGAEEGSIQHKFKFKVEADKTRALLDYSGLMNARLSYQMSEEQLRFEIHRNVMAATDLIVSHTDSRLGKADVVSFGFNF